MKVYVCKDTGEMVFSYRDYLNTEHWRRVKERYNNSKLPKKCYVCGCRDNLNLHHKTYKNIGNERLMDLIYLCNEHHNIVHKVINFYNKDLWTASRYVRKRYEKGKLSFIYRDHNFCADNKSKRISKQNKNKEKNRQKHKLAKQCIGCTNNNTGWCKLHREWCSISLKKCIV